MCVRQDAIILTGIRSLVLAGRRLGDAGRPARAGQDSRLAVDKYQDFQVADGYTDSSLSVVALFSKRLQNYIGEPRVNTCNHSKTNSD